MSVAPLITQLTFNLVGPMTTGSAPGPQLVDYQEGSSIDSALDRLQEDAGVQALRNQYGADVVLLVIGGNADA